LPIRRAGWRGKDDANFCRRISEALALGYRLHGSPACTFNGTDVKDGTTSWTVNP
jgi:hypothetical protein